MLITLAYSWVADDGSAHAPDEQVDVPEHVARALLRDGKARASAGRHAVNTGRPVPPKRSAYRGPKPPAESAYTGPASGRDEGEEA